MKWLFEYSINPFMYFFCYLPLFYMGLKGIWWPMIPVFIVTIAIDIWGRSKL